ncbi:hypothetical protein BA190_10310 [Labrys sp. WJW]|uniref:SOS response-associated peptidase n=1 Tax=Labrys sp. WJW TaxID=1737983 RepID=UPI00082C45A7|nr:SOS response-associated peptidase [Labrys sp. WJW]OCC05287.1 hypothetical protein BA190_10310 [Labrys sp. WJW]
MCGRVHQSGPELPGIFSEMGATEETIAAAWKAHHNGSPRQFLWVIRRQPGLERYVHDLLQWGLLPSWVKDPSDWPYPINARGEDLTAKPSFRGAYKSRRCLIPVDAFFEWMKILEDGKPIKKGTKKQPYAIAMKDRSKFALGGLWESWTDKATQEIRRTFTIVTCAPNSLVGQIHDRMPLILHQKDYDRWLANIEPDPRDLIVPFPAELMDMWPISTKVNSPAYNEADVLDPIKPSAPDN